MPKFARAGGHADGNQEPLVKFARRMGASVVITSIVPNWVDATVGFRGSTLLWEIKREGWRKGLQKKRGGRRKLRRTEEGQEDLRATWRGGEIEIIETVDDVLRSLLRADLNRPMDLQPVLDDYLAAIVGTVRSNLPAMVKGL